MEPAEQHPIRFDALQNAVEQILSGYYQKDVAIHASTLLTDSDRRNRIWRCHLHAAENDASETVIVKQVNPDAYDPTNPDASERCWIFNDWAGAQFLSEVAREEAHGPAFYGGNVDLGLIVLEDLGEHTSLVEPLLGTDPAAAGIALIAFADRLARMHASTIGKEEIYRDIQRRISPSWVETELRSKSSDAVQQARAHQIVEFTGLCQRLNVEPTQAAKQEFSSLLQRLEEPGPFKAFLHCDPCPDNVFYHAPQLRLIDFEFSGFGHALQDGLYGRLPFPTCWCANAVPSDIIHQMENTYRRELSHACPEISDDERFALEASAVTANVALDGMRWSVNGVSEHDQEWGIAGNRARILTRIEVFLDTSQSAGQLPALTDTYMKILAELKRRWPDASPLPVYPAFRVGVISALRIRE